MKVGAKCSAGCRLANHEIEIQDQSGETIARIRREEAAAAAKAIGATFHESICNDLEIFYDRPTLAKVASGPPVAGMACKGIPPSPCGAWACRRRST